MIVRIKLNGLSVHVNFTVNKENKLRIIFTTVPMSYGEGQSPMGHYQKMTDRPNEILKY